ncbi:transfer RNA nucleotidyltransferase [Coprinopsis marcescibilis]|uniref:Transfer RNA nucleotidyltransferase n=1 Tax=Coprinopsis marcescibilis TaxID=230819 RepID=A0A5C3LPQ9_COPMA|nr:transfer RNA nucleotidyltransferase [Coprinopsis marcescibilis]
MGEPFAEEFSQFARSKGVEPGRIGKIDKNPSQSKHLETATFKLFGLDLDFVNLRSEEYAGDSRIPTVSFGTPLEDAMRRDITINALFYNVHTKTVEDFTSKGLDDLKDGVIRTPLPPKETFADDPLRVLRCIRFASRFGFTLVQELKDAARDLEIQTALANKISKERVGVELDKMLKGQNPLSAIELFEELSLSNPVCSALPPTISEKMSGDPKDSIVALRNASVLNELTKNTLDTQIPSLHPFLSRRSQTDPTCRPRLFLASFLSPYLSLTYTDKKNKTFPAVEAIIREALKLGTQNHYLDGVPILCGAVAKTRHFLDTYPTYPRSTRRSSIGVFLRNKSIHNLNAGIHWSDSMLFTLVLELGEQYDAISDALNVERATAIISKYNDFATLAEELDLWDVGELRPLVDGKDVLSTLEAKRSGPWLAETLSKVVEWQLDNRDATKERCLNWLRLERQEGRIRVEDSEQPTAKRPRTK